MLPQFIFESPFVSLWFLGSVVNVFTGLGLFALVRQLSPSFLAQIAAPLFWALLCLSPQLEANQPNSEAFINLFWVFGGLGFLVLRPEHLKNLALGSACAAASLFKPFALILFIPVAMAGCAHHRSLCTSKGHQSEISAIPFLLRTITWMVFCTTLAWAITTLYFYFSGRFHNFYSAVFSYNRYYVGDIWQNVYSLLSIKTLLPSVLNNVAGLLLLYLCFVALALKQGKIQLAFFLSAFLAISYLGITIPGQFYLHYYQYLLPVVILGAAVFIGQFRSFRGTLLLIAVCAGIIWSELPLFVDSQNKTAAPFFPKAPNMKARERASEISQNLLEGQWFYEWGAEPSLYFETTRFPKHGVFHVHAILEGPLSEELSARTLAVLESSPPALVVISKKFATEQALNHPVYRWISSRYGPLTSVTQASSFIILAPIANP
jgi:hypothetical protein